MAVAADVRVGYQVLITCGGLGGMTFNTVVVPLPSSVVDDPDNQSMDSVRASGRLLYMDEDDQSITGADRSAQSRLSSQDYCRILHDALFLEKNVLVACNYSQGHQSRGKLYVSGFKRRYIDVWLLPAWEPTSAADTPTSFSRRSSPGPGPVRYGTEAGLEDALLLEASGVMALLVQLGQTFKQGKLGPGKSSSDYTLRVMRVRHSTMAASQDLERERRDMHFQLCQMARHARLDVHPEHLRVILTSDIYHSQVLFKVKRSRR